MLTDRHTCIHAHIHIHVHIHIHADLLRGFCSLGASFDWSVIRKVLSVEAKSLLGPPRISEGRVARSPQQNGLHGPSTSSWAVLFYSDRVWDFSLP